MTKHIIIASLALGTAALAGTSAATGKGTVAPAPAPAASPFSGSVTLGYDSSYITRGLNYGDNFINGAVDLNYALSDKLTLNLNAWYGVLAEDSQLSVPNTSYNELDLYGALLYNAGPVTLGPTVKWFKYHNGGELAVGIDEQLEFGLVAMTKVAMFDVTASGAYDIEAETWYFDLTASTSIKLTENISLVPGACVGYGDFYNLGAINDFNHVGVFLKLPIALTDTVTLTPYVAGNFPLEAVDVIGAAVPTASLDNEIFGGVSLNVKF
jgi:hypothetical protein